MIIAHGWKKRKDPVLSIIWGQYPNRKYVNVFLNFFNPRFKRHFKVCWGNVDKKEVRNELSTMPHM